MWEKIVLNLLSNALKFTFDGEIAVSLGHRDEQQPLPSSIRIRPARGLRSTRSIAMDAVRPNP
jgi:signal transduction histidine kinase